MAERVGGRLREELREYAAKASWARSGPKKRPSSSRRSFTEALPRQKRVPGAAAE